MNKVIKAVATIMIVVLIGMLIWILMSYYKDNEVIDTIDFSSGNSSISILEIPSGDYINNDSQTSLNGNESLIESIIKNSTETPEVSGNNKTPDVYEETSGDVQISGNLNEETSGNNNTENDGEIVQGSHTTSGDKASDTTSELPSNQNDDPDQLVIFSDPQTSNQEKQEILTEIDKALQGLLEAVGKVETVDEERLDATLNSEVDKP